ncbi:MAG: UDP-N-acetylmuramoyl-L-alanyl-D-glutamate--2,6-diaminopimelate ligase, partial [Clostridia bacterium]|nr:UDP-N-acetylmuramoyl-L-alanyl-D-glutamate--2,6-diaminopimelate ligase [Clostridia bacterium]
MKLSRLLYPGEYTSSFSPEEIEISGIVSDTVALRIGCLFICLRGTRFDSHTLIARVEEAGAAAVIIERGAPIPSSLSLPIFTVPSTRTALALIHSRYHGSPEEGLVMIGVTGTNGKTSTASILYTILCSAGINAGLVGTARCVYNGAVYTLPEEEGGARLRTMTTPDPDILYPMLRMMRDAGVTHVVMEVSSHSLVLDKIAPIHYRIGIFTNLSPEHMDFHNDMDTYIQAKSLLFSRCDVGIFNYDDGYAEAIIARSTCAVRRTGVVWQGDYRATDIELRGSRGVSYSYLAPGIRLRVRTPLPGAFSVYNTLMALTAAIELGVSPLTAADALSIQAPVPGRLERIPLTGAGFSVFIDYAHTEHALRSLLTTVRAFRRPGERIVLLFGCGGDR